MTLFEPLSNRSLLNDWMTAGVFLLGAISLSVPSGYSYATVILVLGSIVYLVRNGLGTLSWEAKLLGGAMLLYAVFWIAESSLRGAGLRAWDEPSRFLFALLVLLAFSSGASVRSWGLWLGIAIGAVTAALLASWQFFLQDLPRVTGFVGADHFGSLAITLGLLSGLGFIRAIALRLSWLYALLCLLGVFAGLYAALLSGTRASWGAAAVVAVLLIFLFSRCVKGKRALMAAGGSIVFIGIIWLGFDIATTGRMTQFVHETRNYFGSGDYEGSISIRFDIWRVAFALFLEKPFLGWGQVAYGEQMLQAGEQGVISPFVASIGSSHAHNQILDALVKRGVIGAAVLLTAYLLPLFVFVRCLLRSRELDALLLAAAGLIVVIVTMIYGLAHNPLGSHSGVVMYAFWIAILGGLAFRPQSTY